MEQKQHFLLMIVLLCTSSLLYAGNPYLPDFAIPIQFQITKVKGNVGNHIPRTPLQAPDVYFDDHSLYFGQEFEDDLVVTLEDEDEVEVYSTYLYAGQTQLPLPGTLSGDFTLCIYKGNFAFIGEITLD